MSETRRWWHYTLARTLAEILVSGAIKRSTEGVSEGERTAVWFSCRTDWEPTATRGLTDGRTGQRRTATIEEMVALGGELVRLEVPETVARYTWADHRRLGQIDPRMADGLERALGGEPAKWRLSYDDVPLRQIVNIEASMDGRSWRSVRTGSEFAAELERAREGRHAAIDNEEPTNDLNARRLGRSIARVCHAARRWLGVR